MINCDICSHVLQDGKYCYMTYYLINGVPVCRECAKYLPNRCPICGELNCRRHKDVQPRSSK